MSRDAGLQLLACRHLRKQTETLLAHIDGVRAAEDIEHVHQSRVASRRIRTALAVLAAAFPAKKLRRWSKHVRRLTKGLGAARDKDVQIAFVAQLLADHPPEKRRDLPGLKRLLLRLQQEREAIQPRVIETLDRLDRAGVLTEMLAWTAKPKFSSQGSCTDVTSPLVLEQGARDIRKAYNRLLSFASCLDDAEAVPQHHQMRIAAKKLRYMMEIYKEPFDNRLNEPINTVRRVQTLLGVIHDCDMWGQAIETFMQAERRLTVEYYGHARSFRRLRPGLEYLRDERLALRRNTFDKLAMLWKDLQAHGFWEEMLVGLDASCAPSVPPAHDASMIRVGQDATETPDAAQRHEPEAPDRLQVRPSPPEPSQAPAETEYHSSLPEPLPCPAQSDSDASATEGSQTEAVDAAPPAPAETIPDFITRLPGDQEIPQHTVADRSTSADSGGARAAQARNAICGCCGTNGFLHEELLRIDSGQLLCPRCLDAFRDKADQT